MIRPKERVVSGEFMFIRFVSSEIDDNAHVSAGLFCAAFKLLDETVLSDHEYAAVADLMGWFRVNLRGRFDIVLDRRGRATRAICWFRCTAHEHLARARELATILEETFSFGQLNVTRPVTCCMKTKSRFSRSRSPI